MSEFLFLSTDKGEQEVKGASRATGVATARPGGRPRNEAKRWASGKSRKTGFAKARATFRGGGRGSVAAAERHDSMMTKARWRGTEAIARETPAGSLSVASMPQRKDYTNDAEHHGKFQVWLQAGSFQGKARDGAAGGPAAAAAPAGAPKMGAPPVGVSVDELPARFRRAPMSEDEMEAVMSGGASVSDWAWVKIRW
ncbi:hypothetical protein EMIHUDRAFT_239437 [Emiliania huxleyi CCMP1516]|uniref:AP2/ERF domain-containing protein n=2 Tax=Emiliania huxleyi TaxID=2903 RepID=A0A0D3JJD0_EMIH1|nr:hypothetical protein EMIHUDRAFT_239437 [Emiliania huxleyi CCMP1516]EOD23615.1 hypothetical protein EMIHUDRAFT_239437 [Emiliania huxleyi CCMP1516]|eukprot:XP_005776044.1 hypothetical protein EMIHUDRAFT_239437 [Emiliania huxleyi CCMP1516]